MPMCNTYLEQYSLRNSNSIFLNTHLFEINFGHNGFKDLLHTIYKNICFVCVKETKHMLDR